jgi:hypothetical protein
MASKKLAVARGMKRKWMGPHQKRGVLSKADLVDVGGVEATTQLLRAIGV